MADREKLIKNIKTGGDLMMYIGSAGLMNQYMRKAQEHHNPAMNACIYASSMVLSLGLGRIASKWLEKAVDEVVAFIDDVKKPEKNKKETEENG